MNGLGAEGEDVVAAAEAIVEAAGEGAAGAGCRTEGGCADNGTERGETVCSESSSEKVSEEAQPSSAADACDTEGRSSQDCTCENEGANVGAAEDAAAACAAVAEEESSGQENPFLEDLRRITAEYANYRKRTEENAELERERALARALKPLLPILDDLDRAEKHGDLSEGTAFATIAQKLRDALSKLGLSAYGQSGESFDPKVHEAVARIPMPTAENESVVEVLEKGYRLGAVELRPAKVVVAVNDG